MFLFKRILIFLNFILLLGLSYRLNFQIKDFFDVFLIFIITFLIFEIFLKVILGKKFKEFLIFGLSGGLFILSTLSLSLILESNIYKIILIGALVLGSTIFLEIIFRYFFIPTRYQAYSLENFCNILGIATLFFGTTFIYSLGIFLNLSWYGSIIIFSLIAIIVVHNTLWVNKINFRQNKSFYFIIPLLLIELFTFLRLLPLSFWVLGLSLTLGAYLILVLSLAFLKKTLKKKTIYTYLIINSFLLLLTWITAKWRF